MILEIKTSLAFQKSFEDQWNFRHKKQLKNFIGLKEIDFLSSTGESRPLKKDPNEINCDVELDLAKEMKPVITGDFVERKKLVQWIIFVF